MADDKAAPPERKSPVVTIPLSARNRELVNGQMHLDKIVGYARGCKWAKAAGYDELCRVELYCAKLCGGEALGLEPESFALAVLEEGATPHSVAAFWQRAGVTNLEQAESPIFLDAFLAGALEVFQDRNPGFEPA
jgi:hypothetical protein